MNTIFENQIFFYCDNVSHTIYTYELTLGKYRTLLGPSEQRRKPTSDIVYNQQPKFLPETPQILTFATTFFLLFKSS